MRDIRILRSNSLYCRGVERSAPWTSTELKRGAVSFAALSWELSTLHWSSLKRMTEPAPDKFELLIIGGGITGCGVARDAAMRGLSVCLVERDDFASGTSGRSSR